MNKLKSVLFLIFLTTIFFTQEHSAKSKKCKAEAFSEKTLHLNFSSGATVELKSDRPWIWSEESNSWSMDGNLAIWIANIGANQANFPIMAAPNVNLGFKRDCKSVGTISLFPTLYTNGKPTPVVNDLIKGYQLGMGFSTGKALEEVFAKSGGAPFVKLNPKHTYAYFNVWDSMSANIGGLKFWFIGLRLIDSLKIIVDINDGSTIVEGEFVGRSTTGGIEYRELARIGISPLSNFTMSSQNRIPLTHRLDQDVEYYDFTDGTLAIGGFVRLSSNPIRFKGTLMASLDKNGDNIPFGIGAHGSEPNSAKDFFKDVALMGTGIAEVDFKVNSYVKFRLELGEATLVYDPDIKGFSFSAKNSFPNLASLDRPFNLKPVHHVFDWFLPDLPRGQVKGFLNTKTGHFILGAELGARSTLGIDIHAGAKFEIGTDGLLMWGQLGIEWLAPNLEFEGLITDKNCRLTLNSDLGFDVETHNTKIDLCKGIKTGFYRVVTEVKIGNQPIKMIASHGWNSTEDVIFKSDKVDIKLKNGRVNAPELLFTKKHGLVIPNGKISFGRNNKVFNIKNATVSGDRIDLRAQVKKFGDFKENWKIGGGTGVKSISGTVSGNYRAKLSMNYDLKLKVSARVNVNHKYCVNVGGDGIPNDKFCGSKNVGFNIKDMDDNGCFRINSSTINLKLFKFKTPSKKICL